MKILVLNCGSSSIKYALYNMDDQSVITSGGIEKIGLPDSFIKYKFNGEKHQVNRPIEEHTAGVQFIFEVLTTGEHAVLKSLDELGAVGHRMVHGGEKFNKSVLLTPEVMEAFAQCNDLAPLHNPANIKGVNAVSALLPNIPQVGVFDTAFHQTMPDYASQGLYVRHSLRALREVRHPSLWLPRNFSSLCVTACLRVLGHSCRGYKDGNLPRG